MDDKRFEHIIQSKLKDYEADVPQDLWSKIENELPRKKTVWMKPVYRYAAAACAALLIGGFTAFMFLYRPESGNHLAVNNEPISITLPEKQEIPTPHQNIDKSSEEILWVDDTRSPISLKKQKTKNADKHHIDVQVRTTPEQEIKVEAEPHTIASPVENKENRPLLAETSVTNRPQSISQEEYERKLKEFESAGQQLQESDYEQILNSKHDEHGFSIGLMASNSLPGNKNMENRPLTRSAMEIDDELNLYSAEEPLKFMHKVPISFGITVEKKLPRNWGLESGIVYTLLRSDYKTASNNRKGKQELHYVGIPLNAIYRFAHIQNASFYAAIGAKADFNVSGRRTENTQNDNKDAKLSEDIRDHRVQWSFHAKAGAAYAFDKMAELYIEPGVSYYVDNSNIPNLWHDRPVNFTVQLGLRTNF